MRFFAKLLARIKAFGDAPHPKWLMSSPAMRVWVPGGVVRIEAHDWTPTDESRAAWLKQHYSQTEETK